MKHYTFLLRLHCKCNILFNVLILWELVFSHEFQIWWLWLLVLCQNIFPVKQYSYLKFISNRYYYIPCNELWRVKCFLSVRLSFSPSVLLFCQRNSSEPAQLITILVKLCSCEDVHIRRKFWLNFFPGSYAPLELRNSAKMKYTTETFCYCNPSETV